jgi:hypothetical protein
MFLALIIGMVLVCACSAQKKADAPRRLASGAAAAAHAVASQPILAGAELNVADPPAGVAAAAVPRESFAMKAVADVQQPTAPVPEDRKLIRRGEMTLEVPSVAAAMQRLLPIVVSAGGHTANRSERQNEYGTRTASLTCRIPAERLDAAIESMKALGTLKTLTLTAEDITTAYFDASIRIDTQTALVRQLVALLQRPTNKLSDLLEIEREVARVREEIDRLQGRKRVWDNQVALSSIAITLQEPAPVVAGSGGGFLQTLTEAFGQSAENFVLAIAGIIATLGSILPMGTVIGIAAWAFFRWRRRHARVLSSHASA